MTPLELNVLLAIYVGSELTAARTDVLRESIINAFIRKGLIATDCQLPSGYRPTSLGKAFVSLILRTPVPIEAFVDPRTGEALKELD